MMNDRQQVRSLKKALRLLRLMNQIGELTVTELSEAVELPRTTTYRLLETLETEGFVERSLPNTALYRITKKVLELSDGYRPKTLTGSSSRKGHLLCNLNSRTT
jgi:IclR family mhp operon transcriptional activator